MNLERRPSGRVEKKEQLPFKIGIVVHRHGPKASIAGPLSTEGKQVTKEYFDFVAAQGVGEIDIEHSPINRTQETAEIFSDAVIGQHGPEKIKSVKFDERLSEGGIAEHPDLIEAYGGRGAKWIAGWMQASKRPSPEVKTGKETAADFTDWILSKISDRQLKGGEQEVQTFSHAPVMVAFILKLEEKIGDKILPEDLSLFIGSYLSVMDFNADSSQPDIMKFSFGDRTFEIPVSVLREIVVENRFMADVLKDVSDGTIEEWVSAENLALRHKRSFEGFEITDSIDGSLYPDREVSLVKISKVGQYPQHVHRDSDAFFTIISGEAILLSGKKRQSVVAGDTVKVPRGMPHGFELQEGAVLDCVSIQSPPIRATKTGEEDFHLIDMV